MDITGLGGAISAAVSAPLQNLLNKASEKRNFEYTKQLNEQQFGYQQELQKQQNDFNLDLWNKTNEYNSPLAQVQRLRDAGLNVGMMMGGQSITSAQPLESANPSVPSSNNSSFAHPIDAQSAMLQGLNLDIQNKELKLRETLLDKQLAREDERIKNERMKVLSEKELNTILGREHEKNIEVSDETIKQIRANVSALNKQVEVYDKQMDLYDADIEQKKAAAEKARQEGKFVEYNAITNRMNAQSQRIVATASSKLMAAQEKGQLENIKLTKKNCEHLTQQILNMKQTHQLNGIELQYKGEMYKANLEYQRGQVRLINIEGDIADDTKYAAIADAYIKTVDNACRTVSDGAAAFVDVATAGATTTLRGQGALNEQSARTGMFQRSNSPIYTTGMPQEFYNTVSNNASFQIGR